MPCQHLALTATLIVLAISGFQPLQAQTPEQRYSDWVRRLDFRPQEYAFRRSYMLRLLEESGGGMLLVPSSDGRTDGSTFRQLDDFWYYTGLEVPNSMLVLDGDTNRATLYLPTSDDRFDNPGRPNDFPGRPLLDDYRLRSIAGVEEYRDIADPRAAHQCPRAGRQDDPRERGRTRADPRTDHTAHRLARPDADAPPQAQDRLPGRAHRDRLRGDGADAHGEEP